MIAHFGMNRSIYDTSLVGLFIYLIHYLLQGVEALQAEFGVMGRLHFLFLCLFNLPEPCRNKTFTITMKHLKYLFVTMSFILICSISHGQRIAVVDFNAGAGISQADIEGLSAIFNTYFSPKGYTLVERTQIDRIIDEQGFQRGRFTQKQMVRIGEILNVAKVVVGDISIVMGEYNVDVRVINVQSGTIAAKDGMTWDKNSSYREMMKQLAERLSDQIAILPVEREPEKPVKIQSPLHRETGGYLSIATGIPMYTSVGYKYQKTPSFSIGVGLGINRVHRNGTLPFFIETTFRTPRYDRSFFFDVKLGIDILNANDRGDLFTFTNPIMLQSSIGMTLKNTSLGIGISLPPHRIIPPNKDSYLNIFLSYDIPIKSIKKTLF